MGQNGNLFAKRNVVIGGSIAFALLGVGFYFYTNRQKTLFQTIWDDIDAKGGDKGVEGDWKDVYDYDFWYPAYLNGSGVSQPSIDYNTAKSYAQKIYAAGSGLVHTQGDVVSVFGFMKNRSDVAKLAQMFADLKHGDLKEFLRGFMEGNLVHENSMQKVYDILKRLPK
jgi:hypothetical protein